MEVNKYRSGDLPNKTKMGKGGKLGLKMGLQKVIAWAFVVSDAASYSVSLVGPEASAPLEEVSPLVKTVWISW